MRNYGDRPDRGWRGEHLLLVTVNCLTAGIVILLFYQFSWVVLYIYVLFLFPFIKRSSEMALLIAPLGELNTKLSRQA